MSVEVTFSKVVVRHLAQALKGLGTWPAIGTLLFHAAFGVGLWASGKLDKKDKDKEKPVLIEFTVPEPPPPKAEKAKAKPKPRPKPKPPEPKPEEKPKVVKQPKQVQPQPRRRRVATRTKPPPTNTPPPPDTPENPDPAPGIGTDDQPYKLPDPVPGGTFGTPKTGGRGPRSGTGTGGGGGKKGKGPPGPPPPPAPVSIAAIKERAMPIGNTDFIQEKDYPAKAKQKGIQGQVKVKLLVNDKGRVVSRTVIKRLGYGLDQLALRYAKRLRFKPAVDTTGKKVASTVVWTFTFTLPK